LKEIEGIRWKMKEYDGKRWNMMEYDGNDFFPAAKNHGNMVRI
jgi:hypothetical protein